MAKREGEVRRSELPPQEPSTEAGATPSARPRVVVITGPSGAGKGTLIGKLLDRMPEVDVAVSATTRERRRGEEDGREYYFLSEEEFDRRAAAGDFLEHVRYVSGHRYGTLRSELARIQAAGRICVLELETEGALRVRDGVPGALTIFVDVPDFEELERRLRARATESAGEIDERLALARRQRAQAGEFEYTVVNDDLERATAEVAGILDREFAGTATMSRR